MKRPKLANGGIINRYDMLGEKLTPVVTPQDKAYKIYYKTKNRRIKKKQLKKSWRLQFEQEIRKGITGMLKPENIKIEIYNND